MFRFATSIVLCLFLSSTAPSLAAEEHHRLASPNGEICLDFCCREGAPAYSVRFREKDTILPSNLGLELPNPMGALEVCGVEYRSENRVYSPIYGEYAQIPDAYCAMIVSLREIAPADGAEKRGFQIEFRAYNEGVALRYVFSRRMIPSIHGEKTTFRLPEDVGVFPISWTESTFSEDAVAYSDFRETSPPLTGKYSDGRAFSIMEAFVVDYPRFRLVKDDSGAVAVRTPHVNWKNASEDSEGFSTPWRAVLLGENEAALIEKQYFIANLNPPCALKETTWIQPGKTISNSGNCQIRMRDLMGLVDFAAENNFRYLQIDWGWYGTEWVYTDAECEEWAKNNPDKASDPTWRANTKPDPRVVAKGLVPYFPRFRASTWVDLDVHQLVAYAKERGVGICLYINDRMLKSYDIDELFALYSSWGLAGLKPGFVAYGSAKDTQDIRRLVEIAAKHRLWLCVHDAYLPDGLSQTYPNLMIVEGGGGQEGNHPASHDTVLPFTRGLVGPFDFTPRFYVQGRSHCHQLSLLVTLYAPAPVIRGAWNIRNNTTGNAFGSELEFFREVGVEWVDTKVLDAEIGRRVVIARKSPNDVWFLGGTNGSRACVSSVSLAFLDPEMKYEMTLWTDADSAKDGWRAAEKTTRIVASSETLDLSMSENGGCVAIFRPIKR
ncbi:MAG: glycoside hydrolase family 97 N-terminal domain-containing protein [Planctomycetia bacterium]|nr:glycoside hydrolase family 97 N-terminal domain-containing protein [Planctomycetia bacterium]